MIKVKVSKTDAGQRVDKYVKKVLKDDALSYIYKLFRKKDIKVNNKKVDINYKIKENDLLVIYSKKNNIKKENKNKSSFYDFNILYEDENILIINKKTGYLIHNDSSNPKATINDQVLGYLKEKNEFDLNSFFTPSAAHRLDRNTSGVLIIAKNLETSASLQKMFKDKRIKKEYLTIVVGKSKKRDTVDYKLAKKDLFVFKSDFGVSALTKYETITSKSNFSFLKVFPLTGRSHQIRVHLKEKSLPILNDAKYGDFAINKKYASSNKNKKQLLHAYKITFPKSIDGILSYLESKEFCAPLEPYFKDTLIHIFDKEKIKSYL